MFAILQEETGRLNQVLSKFLTFARSEPGEAAPFDLVAECSAVADFMAHRPDTPPVRVDSAGDMPAALGNREQIRQVLLNLALNGAAAAGPAGSVVMAVDSSPAGVRCRVTDTGPGFSPEAMANFGTPFYSTRSDGTGLGLAMSLRMVEDLGGTLEPDPSCPEGGRVQMILPEAPLENES